MRRINKSDHQCACLTIFLWHSTSNPKCHIMSSKTKMNVNWHLHFTLKCHYSVTYLVMCVISKPKVSIDVWIIVLHKWHYVSILNCVCQLMCSFVFFSCARFCVSNVTNLQKLCQKHTLVTTQGPHTRGPPHTRAKSRDHQILRAQKTCPRVVPRRLQNYVVWSRALKCSVNSCVT